MVNNKVGMLKDRQVLKHRLTLGGARLTQAGAHCTLKGQTYS